LAALTLDKDEELYLRWAMIGDVLCGDDLATLLMGTSIDAATGRGDATE
jgi:hypothetical protein